MAVIPRGASYLLAWSNGTRRIETTIQQISPKEIRFPALDLKEGVLCISKDRKYRITPIDPQALIGFRGMQIEGIRMFAQFSNGKIEFKIPATLDIECNGDSANFYGRKRFEIFINEIRFDSDPFILNCQPITQLVSQSTRRTAVAVMCAIKKNTQTSKRKHGVPKEEYKPNRALKVPNLGIVKSHQPDATKHYSVKGSEIK